MIRELHGSVMLIVLSAALGGLGRSMDLERASRIRELKKYHHLHTRTCTRTLLQVVKSLVEFLYIEEVTIRNSYSPSAIYLGAATGVHAANLFFVLSSVVSIYCS